MNSNHEYLINSTFEEIQVGDSALITREITEQDITAFAVLSGDINPAHVDSAFAEQSRFKQIVAHGMFGGALISMVLGTKLPGPGTIYLSQTLEFMRPIKVGDSITVKVTVTEKQEKKSIILLDCRCHNQNGEEVTLGVAKVMAPTQKIKWEVKSLPNIVLK
jgi:acyl dehydratase